VKVNGIGLLGPSVLIMSGILLTACSNPDRVSIKTANACMRTLDAGYEHVTAAREKYEVLMDQADAQLDSGAMDEFAYDATMHELKYVLDGIVFAGFVKAIRSQQLADGVRSDIPGIRKNAADPKWCGAAAQFAAATGGVDNFGDKAQAIAEAAREERTQAQQADIKGENTGG
jgi:hypothetical protein